MKGVEARVTLPEDDYRVKVAEITQEEGQNADYLKWKWEVVSGKFKGKFIYDNTSLAPQALWRLANLLTAMGQDVPDDDLELDFEELKGTEVMAVVHHEDYEGRPQAKVADYYPVDGDAPADDDEEDEDEDEKVSKRGKAKKGKADDEDDDDEEDEKPAKRRGRKAKDEDEDDEDEEEEKPARGRKSKAKAKDEDEDDDEEEEEKPARRGRGKAKPKDDEDEDDDEDEKPKKGAKGKGKKGPKITPEELDDMDEDELADVVEKFDLSVDLDDFKTLRKKIAAVKEELEENGQLHDA
jgi:hypothetical protein